jgi:YD repeat-containing protein
MQSGILRLSAATLFALVMTACGGTTSPSGSGNSGGGSGGGASGGQTCRNYASASTTTTTFPSGSNTRTLNCSFNTGTNQLVCTLTISTRGTVSFSVSYASRSDFVDEVSVNPPRMLQTAQTTAANPCGITNGTYNYEGQKRLLNYSINGLTYSYSAWDASGRPTTGLVTGPSAAVNEQWSYGTRTATLVQSNSAGSTNTTYVYDANGNPGTVTVVAGRPRPSPRPSRLRQRGFASRGKRHSCWPPRLLAPGRHDAIRARVGDELSEVFVHVAGDKKHDLRG